MQRYIMEATHEEEYKGVTIKIYPDDQASNPRTEWDGHLGTMVCWHSRYYLGDKHHYIDLPDLLYSLAQEADDTFEGFVDEVDNTGVISSENENLIISRRDEIIAKHYYTLPLYLYDHSGLTMSTGPFGCPWDSGQVGIIYVSKAKVAAETVWTTEEEALNCLKSEVEEYDQYLRGDVYGYEVSIDGDDPESCWGLFGYDYCLEEARSVAQYMAEQAVEDEAKLLASMPQNPRAINLGGV